MKEINETMEAGKEIFVFVAEKLQNEQGAHVGTLVGTFARLSGTSLLRSFEIVPDDIEPGDAILSQEANEEGPKLHGFILGLLNAFGTELDQEKIVINTPKTLKPTVSVNETQAQFEQGFVEIVEQKGFDRQDAAYAAAAACAVAINETKTLVDPHITFGIAAYSVIEGLKTVPLPLGAKYEKKAQSVKKASFLDRFRRKH
jgi:hypothetical protein